MAATHESIWYDPSFIFKNVNPHLSDGYPDTYYSLFSPLPSGSIKIISVTATLDI
jgi:hypothetical protein